MQKSNDIDELVSTLVSDTYNENLQLPDPSLIQYYLDLENRTIWLLGEIDETSLDLVSKIVLWNREDRGLAITARKPIKIMFTSPGGSIDIEETIVSMIRLSKTPIYGFALGMVASAASLIYLSCHRRFALPNAYFIFHKGSCSNIGGNYNEIQAAMNDYREQVEKMEKFYVENTTYPEEIIKEKIQTDWYIHSEEAIKFNIITDIIEDIDIFL